MKYKFLFFTWSVTVSVLLLIGMSTGIAAANEELAVQSIHRISHPAYSMSNVAQTFKNPWNVDNSRILLYESGTVSNGSSKYNIYTNLAHPDFPFSMPNARSGTGRKLIWGCVKDNCVSETAGGLGNSITAKLQDFDFDNASGNQSLIDWDNNTIDLPDEFDFNLIWSPYPGEKNIMYALCERNSGVCSGHIYKLVTYNVDTGILTPIYSYNNGSNPPNAAIIGFTKDATTGSLGHKHEIVVKLDYASSKLSGDVYRIFTDKDNLFANPSRISEQMPRTCDSKMTWYPDPHGIHETTPPDGLYSYTASGLMKNDFDGDQCQIESGPNNANRWWDETFEMDLTIDITHISGFASNDWYIGGNSTQYPWTTENELAPYIGNERIYQVFVNRDYANAHPELIGKRCEGCYSLNLLISRPSAGIWWPSGESSRNYHTMPTPTISPNGRYLHFQGTNGKYTRTDKAYCLAGVVPTDCSDIGNNWEGPGTYIAELAPSSGAQTCTTFNYTGWGECQSNNTQSRTVTSSAPTGCYGGSPITVQSCNYAAPTCSSFTYSAWSSCQPDGTQTRTLASSSPSGCSGGNPVLSQGCTFDPHALYNTLKTATTPSIDGNLGEYLLANSLSFSPSSGGNIVTVRTIWDAEALYIGISVTDTQLNASVTTRDGSVWSEDSIEWFIDTYYDGGGSSNPNSAYMRPDDYHGILSILNTKYDSQGTTSGTPSGSWNGNWQSAVKLNGTVNNNADTDSGYSIEIKIPWTSIGYSSAPSQDTLIGMSFALNDKDSAGVNSIMVPDITTGFENASNWQSVMLSGTAAFVDATPPAPPMSLMVQ